MRSRRPAFLPIALAGIWVALAWGDRAAAQGLDAQIFAPAPGRSAAIAIPEPELLPQGSVVVGLALSHARWPLARAVDCPLNAPALDSACLNAGGRTAVVSDLAQLEASVAVALFDALQLGLVVPGVVTRVADDARRPQRLQTHAGVSDLRVVLDAALLSGATALGAELGLAVPSGDAEQLHGEPGWSVRPALVLRQRVAGAALALQLGYRLRERGELLGFEYDDELEGALGLRVPVWRELELRAELRARVGVGGDHLRSNENPVEGELAAALWSEQRFSLLLGAGAGLWPGRDGYGAPTVRGLVIARYAFTPSCGNGARPCHPQAGTEVVVERDADGDGLAGAADLCPFQAEDDDGFEDQDGCPDRDDDGDGLLDARDQCPRYSEDRDGFEDDDGCPEPDNDDDRIADAADACAMDPEDRDGFEDDDGCPEPGPSPAAFSVGQERILVSERIYFDYEQDTIRDVSKPVLDALAGVIGGLRSGAKVLVEGHTDDSGNAAYDLDLSYRRARAVVEYLRGRGVPAERVDFVGRGARQPLAPGRSAEARALNRRVEFRLVH